MRNSLLTAAALVTGLAGSAVFGADLPTGLDSTSASTLASAGPTAPTLRSTILGSAINLLASAAGAASSAVASLVTTSKLVNLSTASRLISNIQILDRR
jgi:hypothetical protein